MAKKQAEQPSADVPDEDRKLVAKVDKMMATENQDMTPDYEPKTQPKAAKAARIEVKSADQDDDAKAKTAVEAETVGTPPPLDIFADVPGAPPLDNKPAAKKATGKQATKIAVVEADAVPSEAQKEAAEETSTEPEPEATNQPETARPENFDDPVIAEAIEDIVAKEGDVVLSEQDQRQANAEVELPRKKPKSTHHIFWSFVALICLVAVAMTVFIIDPSIHNPFRHIHWSSIRRHF